MTAPTAARPAKMGAFRLFKPRHYPKENRSSPEEAVLLVDPWTLKEIRDGVLQPGNEPTLQENLRRRALDRAHSFRWGAEKARKTMKIYESAVGGGRRCPGGPRLPEGQQP